MTHAHVNWRYFSTVCYFIVTKISLFLECVQAIKHIENLQKCLRAFSSLCPL